MIRKERKSYENISAIIRRFAAAKKFRWRSRCRRNMIQSIWIVFLYPEEYAPCYFDGYMRRLFRESMPEKAAYLMRLRQEKERRAFLSIRHVVRGCAACIDVCKIQIILQQSKRCASGDESGAKCKWSCLSDDCSGIFRTVSRACDGGKI